jgi:hypothetical protein
MPAELRVFLNERGYSLPTGATVRDAIRLALPELLPECETGTALVTDARGLPVDLAQRLSAGAILRAHRSSRRSDAAGPADAGV